MLYLECLLPYGILLLAAVVTLFMRGDIVNKITTILVFAAGMGCTMAESGWWRFGFLVMTAILCRCEEPMVRGEVSAARPQMLMSVAITILIISNWVGDLLGWNPLWLTFPAAGFMAWLIIANAPDAEPLFN